VSQDNRDSPWLGGRAFGALDLPQVAGDNRELPARTERDRSEENSSEECRASFCWPGEGGR
jgi:hypothetical protein